MDEQRLTHQQMLDILIRYFDVKDRFDGRVGETEVQESLRGMSAYITVLERIVAPCRHCGGLGYLDDAEPGDISFNKWKCPVCDGFNIYTEQERIKEEIYGRFDPKDG